MTWWEAIFLGTLQGVTEFLPVSSSGHLVLAQHFLGWQDETSKEVFVDGVLHLGTMLAVLLYFARGIRGQMAKVLRGAGEAAQADAESWPSNWRKLFHLGVLVALATIP